MLFYNSFAKNNGVLQKQYSLNICLFIFLSFKISFTNSWRNSNGDFLYLAFAFDGSDSGSGSSSATFILASRIIQL